MPRRYKEEVDGRSHSHSCRRSRSKKSRRKAARIQNANFDQVDEMESNDEMLGNFEDGIGTKNLKRKKRRGTKRKLSRAKENPITKEDKRKLSKIIESEEVIYNLKHELHSNVLATTAAWDRVATQMDKNGMYGLFIKTMFFISLNRIRCYSLP